MANNKLGAHFTPIFKRFIKYNFKNPIAKTTTGKERFNLNATELIIYGEMVGFHLNGQEIFISEQTLADDYDFSRPTIIKAIKSLVNAGIISKDNRKGKSNIYKLLITPEQFDKMCDAQGIKTSASVGYSKEAPDNQQEAPKQATQQPEKPEAMQSPSQPKNERRRDAGKREIDEHGYPILTSDEMNARYKVIQAAFKDQKRIKLSELRDTFYGPEVMDKIKGTIPDKIWKEKDYWHLTKQALKVAQHVVKRGKTITIDSISHGYDAPKERLWNNCKLVKGELTITK
ncbi:TPA: helix-turn-helix domain-containing protein [Escherichia coli]|nr:helix-turn-helix domain-containing protein [Escherichia coli]HCK2686414.1 helix-turn-helix domain-containing protein [Escherichia coli]HCM0092845.1 helix-turn-helix domain-containing protein [Escherichia coli]HCM0097718.1 helix-turn-helix domain-containing protein [Escherichia coli]